MIPLRSKVTQAILAYYFSHEDASLYVNELCRRLGVDKRHLVVKLRELEAEGLLQSDRMGNQRHYRLNRTYVLYDEYRKIVLKTVGIEARLRDVLGALSGVGKALLFGSYAQDRMDSSSDIDLLVVGDYDIAALQSGLTKVQRDLDREINAVSMTQDEFDRRRANNDPFLAGVLDNKTVELA